MRRPPVALVTGAGNGIGAAVVRRLVADDYDLVLVDQDEEALAALGDEIGPQHSHVAPVDVRDAAAMTQVVVDTGERFGGLDVLVTCAGINAYFDAVTLTEQQWDIVFDVDLKATWIACRAALPSLLSSDRAAIVTVSSIHARMTDAGSFPYAAAKAGVEGLTRSLALDYGPQGVRVNAVAPGWTRTRLVEEWLSRQDDPQQAAARIDAAHPLGRIAEPDEVANVVAFLAGEQASAVTGATFAVDCGLSVRTPIE